MVRIIGLTGKLVAVFNSFNPLDLFSIWPFSVENLLLPFVLVTVLSKLAYGSYEKP